MEPVRCLSRYACLPHKPHDLLWFSEPHGGKRDLMGNQTLSGYHTHIPQHTCSLRAYIIHKQYTHVHKIMLTTFLKRNQVRAPKFSG